MSRYSLWMRKDFMVWHALKTTIENDKIIPLFQEREIWWSALGSNVGFEEDGKNRLFERPVLVLKKFSKDVFWALPMTSKSKSSRYYHTFLLNGVERTVILSQLRLLSSKRLLRRVGKINELQFFAVVNCLIDILKNNGPHSGASGA